jgi:opacity protein-like surface antigen
MQMLKRITPIALLAFVLALPAQARADWFLTPFVGANTGGDAGAIGTNDANLAVGGSLGYMGAGIIGFEVDFGYSPNFFADPTGSFYEGNVTSLMTNLIVGAPFGGQGTGFRPYVSGGVGLLRANVDDVDDFFDVTTNSFGMNVGAGAMVFLRDNVGLRGDVRYFRNFEDRGPGDDVDLTLGRFDFWRASLGVAFRF